MVIMEHCGGASGPIWGSAFRAAGKKADGKTELTIFEFADMMQEAVTGIQKTGEYSFGRGAVVGDKTLIDALVPCADTWTACADKKKPSNMLLQRQHRQRCKVRKIQKQLLQEWDAQVRLVIEVSDIRMQEHMRLV